MTINNEIDLELALLSRAALTEDDLDLLEAQLEMRNFNLHGDSWADELISA